MPPPIFGPKSEFYSTLFLVRLDLGIKIEPLLLTCPAAAPWAAAPPPPPLFFYLRIVLETPNLGQTFRGSIQAFLKKKLGST